MDSQRNGSTVDTSSLPLRQTNPPANPSPPDLSNQPDYPDPFHSLQSEPAAATQVEPSINLSASTAPVDSGRRASEPHRANGSRDISASQDSRRPSASSRLCGKCGQTLHGQFVRALDNTFHLECFTCHDCDRLVASKFFPYPDQPPHQYPLCETDYFKRLDLLCYACGGALRGSHITALERKYHIDHFTCSVCPTVFGSQDSYYEHDGDIYCHYHFSTKFAQRCNGCQTAILKQFVEIFRNGQNQHWHPECYMIHKYWNVRLPPPAAEETASDADVDDAVRARIRSQEDRIEEKVLWIWRTLSAYEEKSAGCISDMLLHVSNGAYVDGVMTAKKFILHVELLFSAADDLDALMTSKLSKGLSYSREAKLLCKKVVAFFQLLAQSQDTGVRRLGVTQELLSLVTALAHYLKLLIRICLQGALRLERETASSDGLQQFLDSINSLEGKLELEASSLQSYPDLSSFVHPSADTCSICTKPIEDRCVRFQNRILHIHCLKCSGCQRDLSESLANARWHTTDEIVLCIDCAGDSTNIERDAVVVSKLQQYVHLLKVAHARLLATLRTSGALPHTSDDPNLEKYDSRPNMRAAPAVTPPLLSSTARSKSYAGEDLANSSQQSLPAQEPLPNLTQQQSQPLQHRELPLQQQNSGPSYEEKLGDIRRLRSTKMDNHLASNEKRARTSRIIGGPEAGSARPGSAAGADGAEGRKQEFRIITDHSKDQAQQLSFGKDDMMKLDDIPRLVAAERAKDQRPNASKYARESLFQQGPAPHLFEGHGRNTSGLPELEKLGPEGHRPKRFLCELSALEYFIVRHVAVLYMEPLLDGFFNQEELLELIEMRKPTFWGKFGKAFSKNDKSKGGRKKGAFGVALDQLVEKDGVDSEEGIGPGTLRIPTVVQDTCMAMRQMDMSMEGVFRKNGNIRRLKEMAEVIDLKGADAVDMQAETPVQIAALLKKFLRELPEPLLTYKLHRLFITSQRIPDEGKRKRILHFSLCLLPKAHRETMEVLFCFLNFAASFSVVDEESGNKMDTHNLATVIAPNILFPSGKGDGVEDSFLAIEAVHSIIQSNAEFSEVPEDIQEILNDSSLFSGSADITTKEILKRFGDIGTRQAASQNARIQPSAQDPNLVSTAQASTALTSGSGDIPPTYGSADEPVHNPQNPRGTMGVAMIHRVGTDDSIPGSRVAHGTMGNTYPHGAYGQTPPLPPNGFYSNSMSASRDSFGSNGSPGRHRHTAGPG